MNRRMIWVAVIVHFMFCLTGKAQWIPQNIPPYITTLLTVDFTGSGVGVAGGYEITQDFWGRAIYTTDGGGTWTLAQLPDSTRSLVALQLFSQDEGYIAGARNVWPSARSQHGQSQSQVSDQRPLAIGVEAYLARIGLNRTDAYRGMFLATTNGGQTWFKKGSLPDSISYLTGSSFLDSKIGYVTGDASPGFGIASILKTVDGGNSWIRLTIPDSIVALRNISFRDSSVGLAVGYQYRNQAVCGTILRTSDGGSTWQGQEFTPVDNFTDVSFGGSTTAFAVGVYGQTGPFAGRGAIYKSADDGVSWYPLGYQPDSVIIEGVRFVKGTDTGIIYGERLPAENLPLSQFIARTTDQGVTWTESSIVPPSSSLLIGCKLMTSLIGYLCGGGDMTTGGLLLHTTNGGVMDVAGGNGPGALHLQLSQNYPNPFNPVTRIVYTLPQNSHVSLAVYDVLGRQVALAVDGNQSRGTHEAAIDASRLGSGVYFYRLSAGGYLLTRKMIVEK